MAKLSSVLFVSASLLVSVTNAASGFLKSCDVGTLGYIAPKISISCGGVTKQLDMNTCIGNVGGKLVWGKTGFSGACRNCAISKNSLCCGECDEYGPPGNTKYGPPGNTINHNTCVTADDGIGYDSKKEELYC
ncbi:hypothetical protein DSL72_004602 [Monilinia vaccinii-corymbosi]|uniref:Cyanovirin-N domain-containing protein n=1 Tax=Monilinia vaccinii-corymbosi TaxID=61207 RepID=A0A8A3NZN1_9HELO|nr:hypothetical protein DSL72_004602 [Monilinia vaccinii-corymbosi]